MKQNLVFWVDKPIFRKLSFSNYLNVTYIPSITHSLDVLSLSSISSLFVYRFWTFLRFCHLEFDEEAISDDFTAHSILLGELVNFK